ncbi:uncharacterized protein OCT59_023042 [Rhizophagus irregularis]|uniref:uncharacterized protein n=1 Tax=Rhizophagus irregularis TaxID=588596 RepID=UPI0019FAD8D3|nr:hypothetical protein OCT59_023042 [Rhizophagus irregularis]GBC35191.2 hypothetical protein GLOIN_2v1785497 [Rhizophagus irregularis DAOM 181602=DAOM 197198]
MGDDKLNVLKNFNLNRILLSSKARKIWELWNMFYQLYLNLKSKDYNEDWLELFLTSDRAIPNSTRIEKGLYKLSAITLYIYVLVYHMAEFMEKYNRWSVKAFSCASVEKKNHQQVTNFFRQTLKDGGSKKKLAIIEIFKYKNRALFYLFDNVEISISKPKKVNIF